MVKINETPDGGIIRSGDLTFFLRASRNDSLAENVVTISFDVADDALEHIVKRLGASAYESKCLARHLVRVADQADDGS